MKSIKTILLCATFIPVLGVAQDSFLLKGKIGNLNPPAKAYLMYKVGDNIQTDSVEIVKGEFEFKGRVEVPTEAIVHVNHDGTPDNPITRPKHDVVAFFIENKAISITATDSISKATFTGSELNDENVKITAQMKPLIDKYNGLNDIYSKESPEKQNSKEFIDEMEARAAAITNDIRKIQLGYAETHPDSYLSIMLLSATLKPGFDAVRAESIFNKLSPSIKDTKLGKESIKLILDTKRTQVGVLATDFTQNDINGKPVKLSDYRGKYVLIDFWASWCAPCRRENPNLKAMYEKYKANGFDILGVSLDKENAKDAWMKAIADDKLTWKHVSDLKGWSNEVAVLYFVNAIPTNFLIDPQGKILAKDLRGEDLQKKLAEIFK
jgi:thiol-disulfide isomerase/thioredoxin